MPDDADIGLHSLAPPRGAAQAAQAGRPRARAPATARPPAAGQKGAGARSGNKRKAGYEGGQIPLHMRMRKLRGPHMKKSMPFEPFRTHTQPVNLADLNRFEDGAEVTPETLRARGLATRKDGAGEDPRRGASSSARTWSCRRTGSAPRRARRSRARAVPARSSSQATGRRDGMIATIANAFSVPGDPPQDPLHVRDPGALPAGRVHPGARRQRRRGRERRRQLQRLQHPRLPEPVLRRRPAELRDLLARDHALHHRVDHPAAADGRGAVAREAPEGRRGRPAEDHAVHALPDRGAGRGPVGRLRVPVPDDRPPVGREHRRHAHLRQAVPDRRSRSPRAPRC